jgi:HAD superfamily PSPase-like hydrolase
MKYKLVCFDCDGVLVDTESSWQWIHDHYGVDNEEALHAYFRDEIDGIEFMRRDIALWKGIDPDVSLDKIKEILMGIPPMKGLDELTRALHDGGCRMVIISGGLDLLVDNVADRIGAWKGLANKLEADRTGRLTGEGVLLVEPRHKQYPLMEVMTELGISKKEVVSIGDTHSDASMFTVSGLGVAFNPADDLVKKKADKVVEEKDLTELMDILL